MLECWTEAFGGVGNLCYIGEEREGRRFLKRIGKKDSVCVGGKH